ncbi:baculoviral IAP repeat-containing protein 5b [Oncorhynchus clarkii lewisi]|uniref:baculoviral IAP repeat-containing protein 5b n=1 Tax=Oncorhynchus clarkii lewisi TaxID=490388 RepID=UPI0039B86018
MASLNDFSARFYSYNKMYSYEMRLQSFADWPFREECQCTPEMMATAGFVHCPSVNEPDVACCFFCLRELEGWEPEDNPWSEHIKRSPNCGFLAMKKDFGELTVAEFYHLEQERLRIYIRKTIHLKIANFRDEVEKTVNYMRTLFDLGTVM